ncbi:MAG: hypothetical protein AAFQ89_17400 [Cyanobacteria bacterium J06626_18]
MAALETVTGVKEQDADKAESAIRGIILGIVAALQVGDIVRATRKAQAKTEEIPSSEPPAPGEDSVEVTLEDTPEAALSPQANAGQFTGSPEPEPLPGQSDPPQLSGEADADALVLTPENAPDPAISIRVGEVIIEAPLSQLAETLHQQSPETLEDLRAALQDAERSPDATTVEIRADDNLKFYRDADNRFVASDFDMQASTAVEDETVTSQPALAGEAPPETVLPESDAIEVEVESVPTPVAEPVPVTATEDIRVDESSEAARQPPINTPTPETQELASLSTPSGAESALEVDEATPTQVVQLPVSEAEALGGQTLAESSTVNPDVWVNQTQVFTAEVDPQGNLQPVSTAAIGQSVDAIADQVELADDAQETTVEYAEQLEAGREQATETAAAQDQFFDERRETSDEVAATQDAFFDERRVMADADAIADREVIEGNANANHNTEVSSEVPSSHYNIAGMLDQACDICYGENPGTQTIQGSHYIISREGDFLSVTAKDGRGLILEKNGDEMISFLTPQDEQNLSAGFQVQQQQQERQFAQPVTDARPGASVPAASQPVATAGKAQLEMD